ncbi:cytochrome c [Dinoroseobacter shibae DFL 12 = DSM 16493]|jgi:cytochrome c|uniref:Cytochrome c n=1 Tax=Dinoroseobacter shibae (strain DSM 16493 / NCIMB 14021 / DFL 12) TaxID=398580 RepID=A8LJ38_DINSH|nr:MULTISPECIES: c-type cytochrome [Dinoroseobacter]ABV94533.1 cytochrome c [Dinoroseobacter shibae DFL 12 = DSM 16493]MDD9717025.1 c-type cytochrome [Dinoroseobacter sp. PD6]URF45960.1 c-type cytochrome [Dinoroseobacter shibae]URF50266.1 c-type cytochrome [Dinoroseobacter shibae]
MQGKLTPLLWAAALVGLTGAAPADEIGDPERGAQLFRQCASCHQIGDGAESRVGPHLNEIYGRRAGSIERFSYSDGMLRMGADGLIWDLRTLDAYIANPRALVSGTRMSYRGMPEAQDRADLLAYMRDFTASPADIPEAEPTALPSVPELPPDVLALQGDAEWGAYLSSECTSCHQIDGTDQGIPSITYWPEEDFVLALHAYKTKLRPHPVMQMIAGRLSNEEIAALAAFFKDPD